MHGSLYRMCTIVAGLCDITRTAPKLSLSPTPQTRCALPPALFDSTSDVRSHASKEMPAVVFQCGGHVASTVDRAVMRTMYAERFGYRLHVAWTCI